MMASFEIGDVMLVGFVMAGLVPAIHVLDGFAEGVDGRDKPGHDGVELSAYAASTSTSSLYLQRGNRQLALRRGSPRRRGR